MKVRLMVWSWCYGLLIQVQSGSNRTCVMVNYLGPVVQSIVNLTSSLVVKMLTVLISTTSNSQVFLLKKMRVQKLLTFF